MSKLLHTISIVLTILLVAITYGTVIASDSLSDKAQEQYEKENYEEVIMLLGKANNKIDDLAILRLRGLTYVKLLDYKRARPLLEKVIEGNPSDTESAFALANILFDAGENQTALFYVEKAISKKRQEAKKLILKGKILVAQNRRQEAITVFATAQKLPDLYASDKVVIAMELASLYIMQGNRTKAIRELKSAIIANPDSFEAISLPRLLETMEGRKKPVKAKGSFSAHIGYKLEHDNHLVVESDGSVIEQKAEADYRHIFNAGIGGWLSPANNWGVFGDTNVYQSKHTEKFERYNLFQKAYRIGTRWYRERVGVNLTYSIAESELDRKFYLRSSTATPSTYFKPTENSLLFAYWRYQKNNYKDDVYYEEEKQSGYRKTLGTMLQIQFYEKKGKISLTFSSGHNDAQGRNWERDERLVSLMANFQFVQCFSGKIETQQEEQKYNHINSVYNKKQENFTERWFIGLLYQPTKQWEITLDGMWIEKESNIEAYAYNRRSVGIGVKWLYP